MEFKIGDCVYINDSAEIDICLFAWNYIKQVKVGIICSVLDPQTEFIHRQYGIKFDDIFEGGHTCKDTCPPKMGQFITARHLQLVEHYE